MIPLEGPPTLPSIRVERYDGKLDLMKVRYREDGWPLCPVCGQDELASLNAPTPTLADDLFCYACRTITVKLGQLWPICAICKKPVERVERNEDPRSLDRITTYRFHCHGSVQECRLDRPDLRSARALFLGQAFSDKPFEWG